jgi:hypothetical protein
MTLPEAWYWYNTAKKNLRLMERLAEGYLADLPDESEIWKDDHFRNLNAAAVAGEIRRCLQEVDDLAIVLLFSSFESQVRAWLLGDIQEEKAGIRHPVLQAAAQEAEEAIERGSFAKVLDAVKALDPDLVELVRQVRRYRNWISHGKRGNPPSRVVPRTAYDRLTALLQAIEAAAR